jgi:NAD(P)-dependent dehydrogenase (short-subunit alcohol dehydrogenase family)
MIVMDVNDEASVQDALTLVLAKAGRLDAVINNAGFSMGGAIEAISPTPRDKAFTRSNRSDVCGLRARQP